MDVENGIYDGQSLSRPQLRPAIAFSVEATCSATCSPPEWFEERVRGENFLKYHLTNGSRINP
jgi:hypothetical protein